MDATDAIDLRAVTLELATLTLGEVLAVEIASGTSFDELIRGTIGQKMTALLVDEIRAGRLSTSSERRRYWNDLSTRRPLSK